MLIRPRLRCGKAVIPFDVWFYVKWIQLFQHMVYQYHINNLSVCLFRFHVCLDQFWWKNIFILVKDPRSSIGYLFFSNFFIIYYICTRTRPGRVASFIGMDLNFNNSAFLKTKWFLIPSYFITSCHSANIVHLHILPVFSIGFSGIIYINVKSWEQATFQTDRHCFSDLFMMRHLAWPLTLNQPVVSDSVFYGQCFQCYIEFLIYFHSLGNIWQLTLVNRIVCSYCSYILCILFIHVLLF